MAKIRVTCPACRTELELDASHEGQEVECGNCLEVFTAARPGGSGGGPKIPGAGARSSGGGGSSSRRDDDRDADRDRSGGGGSRRRPAPKKGRRYDDDDDYEHDRRRDDEFDDYDPRPYRRSGEGDGAATASLVLGIISVVMFCCWPISGPVGLVAAICGGIGLKSQNNKGLAVAGLILGILGMLLAGGFFFVFGVANRFN